MNKCGFNLECSNCVISVTCSMAAQDIKESAQHIPQHSNGGSQSSTQICPKCQGARCRLEVCGVMYGICEMCGGSGKLRHC